MIPLDLLIVLMVLQLIDVASTVYAIRRGIGHEANPVMAWLIDHLGLAMGLLLPKVAMLTLVYLYVLPVDYALPILAALIALYAWVAVSNAHVILTAEAKS